MNHETNHLSSAGNSIFSPKISNFFYIKKYRYRLYFETQFLILLTLFESLKIIFVNMITNFIMSAKMVTLGILKI